MTTAEFVPAAEYKRGIADERKRQQRAIRILIASLVLSSITQVFTLYTNEKLSKTLRSAVALLATCSKEEPAPQ